MAVIHFKTREGMATFIIFMIIAAIIYLIVSGISNNKFKETMDICSKKGINSWECLDAERKNNISCIKDGIFIECKKK